LIVNFPLAHKLEEFQSPALGIRWAWVQRLSGEAYDLCMDLHDIPVRADADGDGVLDRIKRRGLGKLE
jgi:hypothetical protein